MRWILLFPLLAFGCGPVEPIDTDLTNPAGGLPTPTPTNPGPTYDDEGSINVLMRRAEPQNPTNKVYLAAVFAESTRTWRNLGACMASRNIDGFCTEELPAVVGDWVPVEPFEDAFVEGLQTLDVGTLGFAQYILGPSTVLGLDFYFDTNLPSPPVDGNVTLSFEGGAWGDYTATDIAPVPDPMLVLFPDPTRNQALAPGDFRMIWTPGLVGQVYLSVVAPTVNRLYRLEDNGVYDLDVDALGLTDGDSVVLTLGRWTDTIHDQDGNRIEVLIQDEQIIRATYRDLPGRTEIFPADTCGEAEAMPTVQNGQYFGRLQDLAGDLSPSACIGNGGGPDGLLRTEMNADAEITVTYGVFGSNAVLYLMTDCGDFGTCVEGSNDTAVGGIESVGWVNDTGGPTNVFIGLDTTTGPVDDLFVLDIDLVQVHGNVLQDSCADAIYQPALTSTPPGTDRYVGNITTYHNYADPAGACYMYYATGQEGMVKIDLQPGETVEATVTMPGADPMLYLLYNCAVSFSCPVGADNAANETETLTYTNQNTVSETLFLVVDSHGGSASYTLDLLIE